jgi:DNA-directed RNA polymerase I subunit RPA2
MGTPCHNFPHRSDNKIYRIMTPEIPIVRTNTYSEYNFDLYPSGINSVVAVISYTGYDMEDAMIINKSAYDRGFAHGCVYKTVKKEINDPNSKESRFRMINQKAYKEDKRMGELRGNLEGDGLPSIG